MSVDFVQIENDINRAQRYLNNDKEEQNHANDASLLQEALAYNAYYREVEEEAHEGVIMPYMRDASSSQVGSLGVIAVDNAENFEIHLASDLMHKSPTAMIDPHPNLDALYGNEGNFATNWDSELNTEEALHAKKSKRIEFLAQPRSNTLAARDKKRILNELESLRECTFHPRINNSSKRKANRVLTFTGNLYDDTKKEMKKSFPWLSLSPRGESDKTQKEDKWANTKAECATKRLHLDSSLRYELRDQAKEEHENIILRQNCTFRPQISSVSRKIASDKGHIPIHKRLFELKRQKERSLDVLRQKADADGAVCTFRPEINASSRAMANSVRAYGYLSDSEADCREQVSQNVTDRLFEDRLKSVKKRDEVRKKYHSQDPSCKFKPEINQISKKIIRSKPEFQFDFFSRQAYLYDKKRHIHDNESTGSENSSPEKALQNLVNQGVASSSKAYCERRKFTPNIGNADVVLQKLRPNCSKDYMKSKLHKMVYDDPKQRELRTQRLREEQDYQYTYKPKLNPVSKALGKVTSLDKLARPVPKYRTQNTCQLPDNTLQSQHTKERRKSRKNVQSRGNNRSELQTYNGLNNVDSTSKHLCWNSSAILQTIELQRAQREQLLRAKRHAQDLEELKECTFQPNLHKMSSKPVSQGRSSRMENSSSSSRPILVRGLDRFLCLQDVARQQRLSKLKREDEIFRPKYEARTYTIPQPFRLSHPRKIVYESHEKTLFSNRNVDVNEGVFQPKTIEAHRRRLLKEMLRKDL